MGRKYKRLFSTIVSKENIEIAYNKASRGKKETVGYLEFKEDERLNIKAIHDDLTGFCYSPGEHRDFYVYEQKQRKISALPFRDRVVQHALCNVIEPIFEKGMLPSSHACRRGKGIHSGAKECQSHIRRLADAGCFILKTDFSGYFYNIDRQVLWKLIKKKISCKHTLWLISRFLPDKGKGIPIGNLTSQLFANIYGDAVDRYLAQTLKVKRFIRYMDDIVIIHKSRAYLEAVKDYLEWFCNFSMLLFFSKSYIKHLTDGIDFLGYRIFERYKLLRKDSVTKARRKIKRYTIGEQREDLERFIASFSGHAKHSDSRNLMRTLYNYHCEVYQCLQKKKMEQDVFRTTAV